MIVGTAASCFKPSIAAVWRGGRLRALRLPSGTQGGGLATAVNEAGEIGGCAVGRNQRLQPFAYRGGESRFLPLPRRSPGGCVTHTATRGVFVGTTDTAAFGGLGWAVEWRDGHVRRLGKLPGDALSSAEGTNLRGDVVGASWKQVGPLEVIPRAVLYRDRRVIELGALPGGGAFSQAYAINRHGTIVGSADSGIPGVAHAFVWRRGRIHDLNTLIGRSGEWTLVRAVDI